MARDDHQNILNEEVSELGRRPRGSGIPEYLYVIFVGLLATTGSLIPLLNNPRFYFYDDTQSGAFGIWYQIGENLRAGRWMLFDDAGWGAGNYAAEGQWGLWNPLIWIIGVLASFSGSAVIFSSVVKISFIAILAIGTFLLARNYGGSRVWSLAAGLGVSLTGFTVYMDAASWVTGLVVFALLPLAWLGFRMIAGGKSPLLALVVGYLLVSVGYVHGTIMLILVIVGVLLESGLRRDFRRFGALVGAGMLLGLTALAVYLPGVLTAPVTVRESEISNSGFLAPDLTGFASSWIGSSLPQVSGWWGNYSPVPLLYIAWFLPIVLLADLSKVRRQLPLLVAPLFLLIASFGLVLAPSDMGPLRFPVRLTPYVSLSVLLIFAVVVSRCRSESLSKTRAAVTLGVVLAGSYIAWGQDPDFALHWKFTALAIAGVGLVMIALYSNRIRLISDNRWLSVGTVIVLVSLATSFGQHHYYKAAPLPDFGLPDATSEYSDPLHDAKGVTFIVGNPAAFGPEIWDETLLANSWYLNEAKVQNLYSPLMFSAYGKDLCLDSHGWTCQQAREALFSTDTTTGVKLVDLLSIDTVQIIRDPTAMSETDFAGISTPVGWSEVRATKNTLLWVRDVPLLDTGEVVWSTEGTRVSTLEVSSERLVLSVDKVPDDGGAVVISRLNWPGYNVRGAEIANPMRGYLVTLDVPANSQGQEIILEFRPPAWNLVVASLALALFLGASWILIDIVLRVRRSKEV